MATSELKHSELYPYVQAINAALEEMEGHPDQYPNLIREVPGKMGYINYNAAWVFDTVNRILGPENWRYEVRDIQMLPKATGSNLDKFEADITLFVRVPGTSEWISKGGMIGGGSDAAGDDTDGRKGSITDAVKKALATCLGIGVKAYSGALGEQEKAKKTRSSKPAPPPPPPPLTEPSNLHSATPPTPPPAPTPQLPPPITGGTMALISEDDRKQIIALTDQFRLQDGSEFFKRDQAVLRSQMQSIYRDLGTTATKLAELPATVNGTPIVQAWQQQLNAIKARAGAAPASEHGNPLGEGGKNPWE